MATPFFAEELVDKFIQRPHPIVLHVLDFDNVEIQLFALLHSDICCVPLLPNPDDVK